MPSNKTHKTTATVKATSPWRNAANVIFGVTMIALCLTGCGQKSVDSPLIGEKIYSPDNTGPAFSNEAQKPKPEPEKHQYTSDELEAIQNKDLNVFQYRPFRLNGKVYTVNGKEYIEGKYIPDDGHGVHVVFLEKPVPEDQVPQAKRHICGKKYCGAVPIDQAYTFSKEVIQAEWALREKMTEEKKERDRINHMVRTARDNVTHTVNQIEEGEAILEGLGRTIAPRIESSEPK